MEQLSQHNDPGRSKNAVLSLPGYMSLHSLFVFKVKLTPTGSEYFMVTSPPTLNEESMRIYLRVRLGVMRVGNSLILRGSVCIMLQVRTKPLCSSAEGMTQPTSVPM